MWSLETYIAIALVIFNIIVILYVLYKLYKPSAPNTAQKFTMDDPGLALESEQQQSSTWDLTKTTPGVDPQLMMLTSDDNQLFNHPPTKK